MRAAGAGGGGRRAVRPDHPAAGGLRAAFAFVIYSDHQSRPAAHQLILTGGQP